MVFEYLKQVLKVLNSYFGGNATVGRVSAPVRRCLGMLRALGRRPARVSSCALVESGGEGKGELHLDLCHHGRGHARGRQGPGGTAGTTEESNP
eukprot:scaffold479_cov376-Prasinococcus_capsulatus_cf.AAC.14